METLLFIGTQEIIFLLIFGISIVPLIFAIIALIDVFKRDFGEKTTDKILIILLIILAPIIGSIIYYLVLRNNYPLTQKRY